MTGSNSKKPMRVLQILHTSERGGIETLSGMITQGLNDHGITTDTLILFPSPGLGTMAKLKSVARAIWQLLRDDHDAIIAYQATASVLTGVTGFLRGCPHRIVHQTAIPSATAWPVRLADRLVGSMGLYTANIANTAFTLSEFKSYPATYRRALKLIVHGLKPVRPVSDRASTRQRFALPADAKLILNVGRMVSQKNQKVLIDALVKIPDAHLVIAGHGPDEAMLRDLARTNGVEDKFHALGAVTPQDVADLLHACDVFAFPSTWETFGLAGVEAAIAGIPVIASDLPVLREVLEYKQPLVTFVPVDDPAKWTQALQRVINAPPSADDLQTFAVDMAQRYAVSRMVTHYVELLRR